MAVTFHNNKRLIIMRSYLTSSVFTFFWSPVLLAASCGGQNQCEILVFFFLSSFNSFPVLGAGSKRSPQPVPRSRLATRLRRAPDRSEEQVLRVPAHDVTNGEADSSWHHSHLPRPPVLQREGRTRSGESLQCYEGQFRNTVTTLACVHEFALHQTFRLTRF